MARYPPKADTPTIPGRTAMIVTSQVHHCRECGSAHIVRSGRNRYGSQQYQCRDCGVSKAEVLCARQERSSLRGLSRTFGITRKTISGG